MTVNYLYHNSQGDGIYNNSEIGKITITPDQVGELTEADLEMMNPEEIDKYYPKEIEI